MRIPNSRLLPFAAILALALPMAAAAQDAHPAGHDHAATAAVQAPAPGVRYASDAPLRKGMGDIRAAVEALGHYEHGHMDASQALASVAVIERSIGYIVANCKLEPEADEALHGVIGKLGKGIAALKADPANTGAVAPMREAVQDYATLFDDAAD